MAIARTRDQSRAIEPHPTQLEAIDALKQDPGVLAVDVVRIHEVTGSVEGIVALEQPDGRHRARIAPTGRVYPLDHDEPTHTPAC